MQKIIEMLSKYLYLYKKHMNKINTDTKLNEFLSLSLLITASCLIVFYQFIVNKKVYLFKDIGSDSVNIYYPWLVHISGYLKEYGVPTWSFSQGLGQNIFPFAFGDLFSLILAMVLGKEVLPYGLAWMEIIKVFLCGIMFRCYLRELEVSRYISILIAFLYAFSGYVILGGCWTLFSLEAVYAATILFGFERWMKRGVWIWYVAGLSFMSMLQPFFLFMYSLVLLFYIPLRYYEAHDGCLIKFPKFCLKTIGFTALGVAVSAFQLLPDVLQYLESPRGGGKASLAEGLQSKFVFDRAEELLAFSTIFRSFGSDILGTGNKFMGWHNYLESPLFYCGIICLVTLPQFFISLKKAQLKILYGIAFFIALLPLVFPYFRYAFWAFTGDYFRTLSLIITILLLYSTAKSLDYVITTGHVNKLIMLVTVAMLLYILYSPPEVFSHFVDSKIRLVVSLLIIAYALLILALSSNGTIQTFSKYILVIVCFVEIVTFSFQTVNDREVVTSDDLQNKIGYNDFTVESVNYLKRVDKSFYRIEKNYSSGPAMHMSLNDAKVQGYFGTSSYSSFNQINYVKFLAALNVLNENDETQSRWVTGLKNNNVLLSLVSGKYLLSKMPRIGFGSDGFEGFAKVGDVFIYRNNYALPFGFTYDQVIDKTAFMQLGDLEKNLYLMKGGVIESSQKDLASFPRIPDERVRVEDAFFHFETDFMKRIKDKFAIKSFGENRILGEITVSNPKMLFFSIPFDRGWSAKINGEKTTVHRINIGFSGIVIPAGKSVVELYFIPPLMWLGLAISLISMGVISVILFREKSDRSKG